MAKQNTHDLYRSTPDRWKHLSYTDALRERIKAATEAMDYYRDAAFISLGTDKGKNNTDNFRASEKAREFNRKLLTELKDK